MKILLVSDSIFYSTADVHKGYIDGLRKNNVTFDIINLYEFLTDTCYCGVNIETAWRIIHSVFLSGDYTHMLAITGVTIPEWVCTKKYGKKIGIIATDDPHASKEIYKYLDYIDYWFTNEKRIKEEIKSDKIHYVPVAANIHDNIIDVPEEYRVDMCFIGVIYPNRIKIIEKIIEYIDEENLKLNFKILLCGSDKWCSPNSSIKKYFKQGVIDNVMTQSIYRHAKAVLNFDRDPLWDATTNTYFGEKNIIKHIQPYSMNPRSYEISNNETIQVYYGNRKEYNDILGNKIIYLNDNNILDTLRYIKLLPPRNSPEYVTKELKELKEYISNNHTYYNRAKQVIDIIKES